MRHAWILLVALAACSPAKAPETQAASAAPETIVAAPATPIATPELADAWIGKWIGVEGNYLEIAATGVKGSYAVTEGTLDGVKHYSGVAYDGGISIADPTTTGMIRAATGDQTGLKYLAGKQNCLMIESGRGFCR